MLYLIIDLLNIIFSLQFEEADQTFSLAVLIGSLSCVAHLIVQINIGLRNNIFQSMSHQDLHVIVVTTVSTGYMAARFIASSFYADRIYSEVRNSPKHINEFLFTR